MQIYRHQILLTVLSKDPNPHSVGVTVGGLVERVALAVETAPLNDGPKVFDVPEEPGGTIEEFDAWTNNYILPALEPGS